jgi:hypothetical protein
LFGDTHFQETGLTKPNPIVVRPRKASALEAVWNANDRNAAAMREIIHSWANQFAEMAAASEREEDQ